MTELDTDGGFSGLIKKLSAESCDPDKWENVPYQPNKLNTADKTVFYSEQIASYIVNMLREQGFTRHTDPYLERYVDEILSVNGLL